MFHYQQIGHGRNQQLPFNILRRGPRIYYSINFQQHKNVYDFSDERIADYFFDSVHERFVPGNLKMQGYDEVKNYQRIDIVEIGYG